MNKNDYGRKKLPRTERNKTAITSNSIRYIILLYIFANNRKKYEVIGTYIVLYIYMSGSSNFFITIQTSRYIYMYIIISSLINMILSMFLLFAFKCIMTSIN